MNDEPACFYQKQLLTIANHTCVDTFSPYINMQVLKLHLDAKGLFYSIMSVRYDTLACKLQIHTGNSFLYDLNKYETYLSGFEFFTI